MQPITLWRRLTQFAFFILTGQWLYIGWLRCPYGIPFVNCGSCPLRDCWGTWLQNWFIGLLAVTGVVFGRAFCGWGCPMGLVEDALGRLPKPKWHKWKWYPKLDQALKLLKYVSLALVVWGIFALNYPDYRAHAYVVRTPSILNVSAIRTALEMGESHYAIRIGVLIGALVLGLLVFRGWCRYLCPLGAIMGIFNKICAVPIKRDLGKCTDCGLYPRECIQHTLPGKTDCVACGDCVQGCKSDAITLSPRRRADRDDTNEQKAG